MRKRYRCVKTLEEEAAGGRRQNYSDQATCRLSFDTRGVRLNLLVTVGLVESSTNQYFDINNGLSGHNVKEAHREG